MWLRDEVRVVTALDRQRTLNEPKTKRSKRTIVDPDLMADVAAHLKRRGLTAADGDTLLFVNSKGSPLSYSPWRRSLWLPALRRAGLDQKRNGRHLGFHDLRPVDASIMNAEGVDPRTALARLGHSNMEMYGRYARPIPRRNRQAAERIHGVLRRQPRDAQKSSAED
jgi:hypothetical protein